MVHGLTVEDMSEREYREFQQRGGGQQRRKPLTFQHDPGDGDRRQRIRRRLSDGGPGAVVSTSVVDLVHATAVRAAGGGTCP